MDIDPEVADRARAVLEATGYGGGVTVARADAGQGVPEFDGLVRGDPGDGWRMPEGWEGSVTMGTSDYVRARFVEDPVAAVSARLSLCRPCSPVRDDELAAGVRPWGLRGLVPATEDPTPLPATRYDHHRQISVLDDDTGRALIDLAAGPPTAPTTQKVDGEDPPSSEDWKNDFAPDDPACPF